MTAQTHGVTDGLRQASATAKARADAAYGNVEGIERTDLDKSDETARLHDFVAAVDAAVPRKVAVDDGPLINRTYRLPETPDTSQWSAAFRGQAAEFRAHGYEGYAAWAEAVARQLDDATGAPHPPVPLPGTVLGSGKPGDIAAVPADVIERAAYRPVDYEATGQTTRAGLDEPGDAVAADFLRDPVEITERGQEYVATCRLCPDAPGYAVTAGNPGAARASLAGHLRRAHNRSPWPGSA